MKTLLAVTAACMLATSALAQGSATFAGCMFVDPIFSREPVADPTFSREPVADVAKPAATGADPDKPSATMVVASGDKARPNLCARLFTVAAEHPTTPGMPGTGFVPAGVPLEQYAPIPGTLATDKFTPGTAAAPAAALTGGPTGVAGNYLQQERARFNTPQWLVALNASPIEAVESPIITAAAAWINGTPPTMGDVMAYGEE
jgi:hypothetical protein